MQFDRSVNSNESRYSHLLGAQKGSCSVRGLVCTIWLSQSVNDAYFWGSTQTPWDPGIQIIPTLGPKACKCCLHWAIWIPRELLPWALRIPRDTNPEGLLLLGILHSESGATLIGKVVEVDA